MYNPIHVYNVTKEGFEADDVIGTISKMAYEKYPDIETIIVTGDLDALQLVNERVKVFTLRKGINDTITYDISAVKERYNLEPSQLIDLKAIQGDASDNIKGVKGIGAKGANDLIQQFGSLEKFQKEVGFSIKSKKNKNGWHELIIDEKDLWKNKDAAEICPAKVIHIIDMETGEQLV